MARCRVRARCKQCSASTLHRMDEIVHVLRPQLLVLTAAACLAHRIACLLCYCKEAVTQQGSFDPESAAHQSVGL